ncbi:TetR family transcriptional regulator C-terminal domain-containing protein [Psychroserpens sp. XS_ASV72]|uniref:TetR family transcriptional regulator C-terminal domain-containing protein n=1 Tax=Psychroserpens sp. XS_ASV72 TaxID=3241293 RepID=UPI003515772C
MAKKKNITANDIISMYMDYVLEHNEQPKNVYSFSKANNFEESKFYHFFTSFESIEKQIFKVFYDHSVAILEKNEDYQSYDARNKLLSFYFTFFENLSANRSYVIYALEKHKNSLKHFKVLSELKDAFTKYIDNLGIELIETKQEQIDKFQRKTLKNTAWLQLMLTMKFWMEDQSPNFEKTDIFIEKSVNTTFDVIAIAPIKSLIDLGKFLYKEKIHMN